MRVPVAFTGHRDAGPAWASRYRSELRISDLADKIWRADGKPYSASFVSRVERGWGSAPLNTYISFARCSSPPPNRFSPTGSSAPYADEQLAALDLRAGAVLGPREAK